jgi:hypothetical protein
VWVRRRRRISSDLVRVRRFLLHFLFLEREKEISPRFRERREEEEKEEEDYNRHSMEHEEAQVCFEWR